MNEEPTFTLAECQAEYLCGVREGKRQMGLGLLPKTVQITFRVLDDNDNIEAVTRVVSFEDIQQSSGKALHLQTERTLAEIATQGIIKKLIES